MTIYDPLSEYLGLEPVSDLDYLFDLPAEYDPNISSIEAKKRNAEIVTCDRCGQTGNRPNMMRWHFDKCQTNLKQCLYCGLNIPPNGMKRRVYENQKFCNKFCYIASKKGINPIDMTPEIRAKISRSALSRSKKYSKLIKKTKPWEHRWGKR